LGQCGDLRRVRDGAPAFGTTNVVAAATTPETAGVDRRSWRPVSVEAEKLSYFGPLLSAGVAWVPSAALSSGVGSSGDFRREAAAVSKATEFVVLSVMIGGGATITMDLWAAVLRRFGVPSLDFAHLGRWLGHLPRGRLVHERIAKAEPIRGEALIGWCAHYSIGVTFAALLLATFGLAWARSPTLGPALLVGAVTVVAPLFVLQPALGAGIASSKTARPAFNSMKSLLTHVVFGFGLFVAARATASFIAIGP